MSKFTPQLYIDIGATGAYFTLRETYLHTRYIRGGGDMGGAVLNGVYQGSVETEVRSFHHFNLSQNADEAFAKATAASEAMGMELTTTRESMAEQMRVIKRATAEQLAERERFAAKLHAEWEAERAARMQEKLDKLAQGVFPFGPHKDEKFEDASIGYLDWMMRKVEDFEEGSLVRLTAEAVLARCSHLMLPTPDAELTVGEPGKRLQFTVTVVKSVHYDRTAWNGYGVERVYVTTMVDASGACLVCFSGAFAPYVGDKLTIKATVKEHSEYKGQAQTIVQRVKEL